MVPHNALYMYGRFSHAFKFQALRMPSRPRTLCPHCPLASCPFCHEYSRIASYTGVNPALIAISAAIKAFYFHMKTQV